MYGTCAGFAFHDASGHREGEQLVGESIDQDGTRPRLLREHVVRHAAAERSGGILHQHRPANGSYRVRAGNAVVEIAGQHNSDDAGAVAVGGRAEQRIDGGSLPVLRRPARESHVLALHE